MAAQNSVVDVLATAAVEGLVWWLMLPVNAVKNILADIFDFEELMADMLDVTDEVRNV
jgi:hypothetical protein